MRMKWSAWLCGVAAVLLAAVIALPATGATARDGGNGQQVTDGRNWIAAGGGYANGTSGWLGQGMGSFPGYSQVDPNRDGVSWWHKRKGHHKEQDPTAPKHHHKHHQKKDNGSQGTDPAGAAGM